MVNNVGLKKYCYLFVISGVVCSFIFSGQFEQGYGSGDLNNDGRIDVIDLNLLHHSLLNGEVTGVSVKDQNGDGKVDVIDLQLLLNRLSRKWQEKGKGKPAHEAVLNVLSRYCQSNKENIVKHQFSVINNIEQGSKKLCTIFREKTQISGKEPYFLLGFLCHAPPVS
ncbi:MAG: dockerin type I domain-containing protein [Candidatus Hydrogenedens sp.]|nr:dockerin type I domain-containing protein [Candidatus Hydrogenedens sp.]